MHKFLRILRIFLVIMGGIFLLITILAFTSAPFWIWYNMSVRNSGIHRPPEYVILLGGGGMPSESGLMRCWYTAGIANYFHHSEVIIALPGKSGDSLSSVNGMKRELLLRGISPERILTEDSGTNTRSQALNIFRRIGEMTPDPDPRFRSLLIVTSPEHLNRAVLTFRKAGFRKVDGLPAFESALESELTFDAGKLGGRKMIPDIGKNLTLRYQFWTQLHYEELIFRELFALGYYKVKGWI